MLSSPLALSRSQLEQLGAVDYRVVVTNTGELAGAVSVLAFIRSDVSSELTELHPGVWSHHVPLCGY